MNAPAPRSHLRFVQGADGYAYIYDPLFELHWLEHVHIPQLGDDAVSFAAGDGLGNAAQFLPAANMALNFVPGVGPFLSAGASLVESIFHIGGGDPTPRGDIWTQLIELREQIADGHRAIGIQDDFTFSGDPKADREGGDVAAWITNETLHLFASEPAGISLSKKIKRESEYQAITALKDQLQQLGAQTGQVQQQQHDQALLDQVSAIVQGGAGAASAPAAVSQAGMLPLNPAGFSGDALPWIVLAGSAGLVVFMMASVMGKKQ